MPFFIATMSHPDGDGWDRLFGAFAAESSGHRPGQPAPLPREV
ncbi:hypothetical protein [Telmatospirillum siberiense]|nr:hypothetical protein [Telmatospirillum siberiense]